MGLKVDYTLWKSAVVNTSTFTNVLREAGDSDARIQAMFGGTPLCFDDNDEYVELRKALKQLVVDIQQELGWTKVNSSQGVVCQGFLKIH